MAAFPAAPRLSRRTLITFLLCFLAFSFAMEAKMAWYGPVEGHGSDVRAAKAMPADAPEIVSEGVPAPDPLHPQFPVLFLLEATPLLILGAFVAERFRSSGDYAQSAAAHHFYPAVFFRPPPVR